MQPVHTPPIPQLLTTEQAAEVLAVKPSSLVAWRCTRAVNIPHVKIGHAVRYRRDDLVAFLESSTVGG